MSRRASGASSIPRSGFDGPLGVVRGQLLGILPGSQALHDVDRGGYVTVSDLRLTVDLQQRALSLCSALDMAYTNGKAFFLRRMSAPRACP